MPYRKNMRKTLKKTKKYRGKYSYNKSRNTKRKYTKRNNRKNFTKRNFKYTKKLRGGSTKTKTVSWGNLRIYENEQTRQRLGIGIYDDNLSLLIHAHYILESVLDKNKLTVKIRRGRSGVKPITYRADFAGNKLGRKFLQPGETGKIVKTINKLEIGEYSESYFERLPLHSSEYTIYSLEINEGTLSGGDPCIDIEVTFAHDSHPLDLKQKIENIQQTPSGTEEAPVRATNEMEHLNSLDIGTLERKLNANNESIKVYINMSGDQSDNIQKLVEQNARIEHILVAKKQRLNSLDDGGLRRLLIRNNKSIDTFKMLSGDQSDNIQKLEEQNARIQDIINSKTSRSGARRRAPPSLDSIRSSLHPLRRRPPALPSPGPYPVPQRRPPPPLPPLPTHGVSPQQPAVRQGPAMINTQDIYLFAQNKGVSYDYVTGLLSQYDPKRTQLVTIDNYGQMRDAIRKMSRYQGVELEI